jgi:ATP-dependent protease HslVU (ClpYQ) peptidase subunit
LRQSEEIRHDIEQQHILIGQAGTIGDALHLLSQISGQVSVQEADIREQGRLRYA